MNVLKQLSNLERLSHEEIKAQWRALYGREPSGQNRRYLIRRISHRIQELAYGGVSEATRAKLRESLAGERLDTEGAEVGRMNRRRRKDGVPVLGTRLVRFWNGGRYEVVVVEGGFSFDGRLFRSLTAVAKAVTGQHRNGPEFFGLKKAEKKGE